MASVGKDIAHDSAVTHVTGESVFLDDLPPLAGELLAGIVPSGRGSDTEITIFKSLGLAVEDVTAADLAYRRAVERGIGQELEL